MSDPFRVLIVCTGNICRSPIAELLFRQGLADRLGAPADRVVVRSAGTQGLSGSPIEPEAGWALEAHGIDGSGFRARLLVAEHVAAADLVLAATREHRAAAVVLQPRAAARTFTLREFARLSSQVPHAELPDGDTADRARAVVRAARAQRGLTARTAPGDDDVVDPYGGPLAAFVACAELVHASLQGPLDLLCGPPARAAARPSAHHQAEPPSPARQVTDGGGLPARWRRRSSPTHDGR